MLRLFDTYASLFKSWRVVRYEQEGTAYMLQLSAVLLDDSRLGRPAALRPDLVWMNIQL